MKKFYKHLFVFLIVFTLCEIGSFEPWSSDFISQGSVAEAHHRWWHRGGGGGGGIGSRFCQRFPDRCQRFCERFPQLCQPPTVSELPIQYMVLSGAVLLTLSGGMVFLIRQRKVKISPEA